MARVLILFAHPALERSRVHRQLVKQVAGLSGVTFHDLYDAYPYFDVDVKREQGLLLRHDVYVLQHPFYWYSAPALVKQWEDLVLEHGWAYGKKGTALQGKIMLCAISAGGVEHAYREGGHNRHTMRQFLAPLEQTARLCGMEFVAPYVIHGTHRLDAPQIEGMAAEYRRFIEAIRDDRIDLLAARDLPRINAHLEDLMRAEASS
ncbi:MAG: NAD(P)H-dependent oxidoreductase [Deltaproteobacteria bacterium]|nr:NAD(P)H-dependent oxidoreductase [Deltaproteobacteria bacterium]